MRIVSGIIKPLLLITLAGLLAPCPVAFAQASDDVATQPEISVEEVREDRRIRRLGEVTAEEYEIDLALPKASPGANLPATEFELPDPEQNAQLEKILSSLASRPGNSGALKQLDALLSDVLSQAHQAGDAGRLAEMQHLLGVVRNVNPSKKGLDDALRRLDEFRKITDWLDAATTALEQGDLLEPEKRNALYFYREVLRVDPLNEAAGAGVLAVQEVLVRRSLAAANDLDFDLAFEWLEEAAAVREGQEVVETARAEVMAYHAAQARQIEEDILGALVEKNFDYAEFILIDLIALGGYEDRVAVLRDRIDAARKYGRFSPGEIIRDFFVDSSVSAPLLVVVQAGSFLMGSLPDEEGHADNESPKHRVTISQGFALGQKEVTVAEFRKFVESTGYKTQAEVVGSSRIYEENSGRMKEADSVNWRHDYLGERAGDELPVLHVDWFDAKAYLKWLSKQTGHRYRLPTEAEFEYALRAGSVTRYWWGDGRPEKIVENLTGDGDVSSSGRGWTVAFRKYRDDFWGPAPVGSFASNPFGLHDMAGNVSEWIEDCWHDTYARAPIDGAAWVNPGCERRVVRGGFWASSPDQSRSAARLSANHHFHGARIGFRVARDL